MYMHAHTLYNYKYLFENLEENKLSKWNLFQLL